MKSQTEWNDISFHSKLALPGFCLSLEVISNWKVIPANTAASGGRGRFLISLRRTAAAYMTSRIIYFKNKLQVEMHAFPIIL